MQITIGGIAEGVIGAAIFAFLWKAGSFLFCFLVAQLKRRGIRESVVPYIVVAPFIVGYVFALLQPYGFELGILFFPLLSAILFSLAHLMRLAAKS